jgi:predicted transcriptional regulator
MAEPITSFPLASEDEAAYRAAVEAGIASLEAGRGAPLAEVRRWMATWFREEELPPPECP